jgi:hypothetical protein
MRSRRRKEPHHLVGAGAVMRCGSGSNQMMRFLAALAPQHWILIFYFEKKCKFRTFFIFFLSIYRYLKTNSICLFLYVRFLHDPPHSFTTRPHSFTTRSHSFTTRPTDNIQTKPSAKYILVYNSVQCVHLSVYWIFAVKIGLEVSRSNLNRFVCLTSVL